VWEVEKTVGAIQTLHSGSVSKSTYRVMHSIFAVRLTVALDDRDADTVDVDQTKLVQNALGARSTSSNDKTLINY